MAKASYALPVDAMAKIIADFNLYGRARHGWVGVNVTAVPDTGHDGRTVRVVQVLPGTPASQSGIQSGDTVMRIDSREIYRPSDVLDASFFSHVGGTMIVVVRRDDKLYDYSFAVTERPSTPNRAGFTDDRYDTVEFGCGCRRQAGAGESYDVDGFEVDRSPSFWLTRASAFIMQDLKTPSRDATILATCVVSIISVACAGWAVSLFVNGHSFTGLKVLGVSIIFLGGCFDPINWLWLCIPFTFSTVVQPPLYSRFSFPIWCAGFVLILLGWIHDGWLFQQPKKPETTVYSQAN